MARFLGFLLWIVISIPAYSSESYLLNVYVDGSRTYRPEHGDKVELVITSKRSGYLDIEIYSEDGHLIRKAVSTRRINANGVVKIEWDGRGDSGEYAPEEVYFPRVILADGKGSVIYEYNPLMESGGEILENIPASIGANDNIAIRLSAPSRLLVRAGIHAGPLLKTFSSWVPYPKGMVRFDWDGKLAGVEENVASAKNFRILSTGYKLPDGAIIIKSSKNYWQLCSKNQNDYMEKVLSSKVGRRSSNSRISARFLDSKCEPAEPRLELETQLKDNMLTVLVDVSQQYENSIQQDYYEVTFFINNKFVSEREQGYMPMEWSYDVGKFKGVPDILTVNVSGYKKQIGTASKMISKN